MNQREVIYADIHVVTAESGKFETILDDDRVEYAKLNHNIKMASKIAAPPKQEEDTSENCSNFKS